MPSFTRLLWATALLAAASSACRQIEELRRLEATALLEPAGLDFGEVPVGEWREERILLRNAGKVPLHAFSALGLSGEPSFLVELEDGLLVSGEQRELRVRFHPLREGEISERLRVSTDADEEAVRLLPLRGVGTPAPVRVYPPRLEFQTLELESERFLELTVENPVDLPLTLEVTGAAAGEYQADRSFLPPRSLARVRARYFPRQEGAALARVEVKACPACTPATVALEGFAVKSAFSFEPSPLPFELVPVHESTRSSARATNVTWRAVEAGGLSTSDPSFLPRTQLAGRVIGPGETIELEVEFQARFSGPSMGSLAVGYRSDRERSSELLLDARGGRPQLALTPAYLDFGPLPVGGKLERRVLLSNAGSAGELHFQGLRAQGDVADFGVSPPRRGTQLLSWSSGSAWPELGAEELPIAPGSDSLELRVAFQPSRAGPLRAELVFRSDDLFHPERTVVAVGSAYEVGPCTFRVLPEGKLDFGNVPTGKGAVLGFRFENAGTNPCVVKDIHLSGDGGGVFSMPGGPLAGGVVIRDDSFAAQIAFQARADGRYRGELSLTVNDPGSPLFKLPIEAVAQASCLSAAPPYLDFGPIRYDCEPEPRRTFLRNLCPGPLSVSRVWIGPGTSDQFRLVSAPALPLVLSAGEGFELVATYGRTVHGQHYSPLWVEAVGETAPLLVPLLAETNHEGVQLETFVQGVEGQLDLLFVVANTTTMQAYQERLKGELPAFLDAASRRGVELRLGVTTTGLVARGPACPGGAEGGEAGRLFPVDGSTPRVVSGLRVDAVQLLQQNLSVGLCHNLVQGLETMRAALTSPLIEDEDDPRTPQLNDGNRGLLRSPARLAVIFLADEDDHSGFEVEGYVQLLRSLKGPGMAHRVAAHALVPLGSGCLTAGSPGPRFAGVAQGTGGEVLSVCGGYAGLLSRLVEKSSGPQASFPLSFTPSGEADISLTVDGAPAAPGSWGYDSATNSILFQPGAIPPPGSKIRVRYRSVCPGSE